MKRRMANKIENYKILPKRLINKYMSLSFEQGYFSVSIEFKGCAKVYVRDVWGRILIYSLNYSDGKCEHSHGYKMWNDDVLYHVYKEMKYDGK